MNTIVVHVVAIFFFPCLLSIDASPLSSKIDTNKSTSTSTFNPNKIIETASPTVPTYSSKSPIAPTYIQPTSPTTTTSTTTTTTYAPPPIPPKPDRKFDGASFIGGIVLCAGLTAIGFVSWRFYKARMELSYRTL